MHICACRCMHAFLCTYAHAYWYILTVLSLDPRLKCIWTRSSDTFRVFSYLNWVGPIWNGIDPKSSSFGTHVLYACTHAHILTQNTSLNPRLKCIWTKSSCIFSVFLSRQLNCPFLKWQFAPNLKILDAVLGTYTCVLRCMHPLVIVYEAALGRGGVSWNEAP